MGILQKQLLFLKQDTQQCLDTQIHLHAQHHGGAALVRTRTSCCLMSETPNCASVSIHAFIRSIMEGPSLRAYENQLLGRFEVAGLRHLPSGILVTFAINSSGIIEVPGLPKAGHF